MTFEILTALALFALVSSITPGPNNLMLMASGANFGFQKTIPHMLGVGLGFALMIILVGIGLVSVFDAFPLSYEFLRVFSVVYLTFLAYKIANSAVPHNEGNKAAKPFTFTQAALFQWVNPKAWTMALTATTVYSPGQTVEAIIMVAFVFGLINLPSVSVWAVLGLKLKSLLTNGSRLKMFNYSMAGLLVASLYPVLIG